MGKIGISTLKQARDNVVEIDTVLRLSIKGWIQLARSGPLVEALGNLDRLTNAQFDAHLSAERVQTARSDEQYASAEKDRGFPLLHHSATVALWGALEAAVEDLALEYLEHDRSALDRPPLASIKIPLVEFSKLSNSERLGFLLAEFTRRSSSEFRPGIGRFEPILELVGLSGGFDSALKRDLLELQQVRNVLVHRAGVADARIVKQCPWLGLNAGSRITVLHDQYARYFGATLIYLFELIVRMMVRDGRSREDAEREVQFADALNALRCKSVRPADSP